MILESQRQGAVSADPTAAPSARLGRTARGASWKASVILSAAIHLLVGGGVAVWLMEQPTPETLVVCTQCAFVEPEAAEEAVEDEVSELEPVEIEAYEPLPELEPIEMPEEVVLPDELPALERLPDTPSLEVSPRMFKRKPQPIPPPVEPPPTARPQVPTVVPVSMPVRADRPVVKRRGSGRLKARFIPPSARYYPSEARRRGIEGTVIVVVTVDARGAVIDVQVSRSSGSRLLDDAAIRLMYDARFTPPGSEQKAKAPVNFILQ